MANKCFYPIRYVSQRTGLTPHVIRAWEKRYQAVVPHRSSKNRRLYSEDDVQRLQLLKKITDTGNSISQVAKLSSTELLELAQHKSTAFTRTPKDKALLPQRSTDQDYFPFYFVDIMSKIILAPLRTCLSPSAKSRLQLFSG